MTIVKYQRLDVTVLSGIRTSFIDAKNGKWKRDVSSKFLSLLPFPWFSSL
jgi:hypothetical protein